MEERSLRPVEAVQCRIELEGTTPLVWRRIHVLANSSLRTLQYAICDVMDWKGYHLYQFHIGDDQYGDPDCDREFDGWLDDSKMTIGRVAKKNSEFKFIYDFGDNWQHRVVIEDVFPVKSGERYPVCVAGENAAPPEDCGGVDGFEEFKRRTKSIKFRKPRNALDALKISCGEDGFDPTFFDLKLINQIKLKRRRVSSN